jgi:hypothetical protein
MPAAVRSLPDCCVERIVAVPTGKKNSTVSSRPSIACFAAPRPQACAPQWQITSKNSGDNMKTILGRAVATLCVVGALGVWAVPASAQTGEMKEKPRLYSYVANWVIPRARWDDMEKASTANQKILDGAVANGTILGYGDDTTLVHQVEGPTHDDWWVATSMAGLFNVLDQIYKSKSTVSPVLASATKHWDNVYVSRFYGWHPGTVKGGYVHGASYKLKADAPNDALDILSKGLIVPLMEKLMADGAVSAYQVAEETIHTEDPGMFFIFFITPNAEGLDKVNAALRAAIGANSLAGPAFGSMVDFAPHRDELARGNSTLK